MNFEYNDEQQMVRDVARRFFVERATIPSKVAWDEGAEGFDRTVWKEIAELGWLHFAGAHDADEITYLGILAEEIGRASYASPFLHCVDGAILLSRAGAPEALRNKIADGRHLVGVLRPGSGRKPITLDNGVLRGGDALVEWGVSLDSLIVPIRVDGGYSLALVDLSDPRVKRTSAATFDNGRSSVLSFDDVVIDAGSIFHLAEAAWREAAGLSELLFASEAVGGAYGAIELTAEYTRERRQFGHPIAAFQAVRHGLADARALTDGAWLAVWDGLGTAGRGELIGGRPALATWLAKRAFQDAALKGSQYHGGMGHVIESHMQFFYRRAGSFHGRSRSEWDLLGDIAAHYVTVHMTDSASQSALRTA